MAGRTTHLRITLQDFDTNNNEWGRIFNTAAVQTFEDAQTKKSEINLSIPSSPYTVPFEDTVAAVLELTGVLTGNFEIVLPDSTDGVDINRVYTISGAWAGNFTVDVNCGGANLPDPIGAGDIVIVYTKGTEITEIAREPITSPGEVPVGVVMLWSGSPLSIPNGWQLCDGQEITVGGLAGFDTPDLSNKFVISTTQENLGVPVTNIEGLLLQTGGSATGTVPLGGAFVGTTGDHTITEAQLPVHTHTYTEWELRARTELTGAGDRLERVTQDTSGTFAPDGTPAGGQPHNHALDLPDHTHDVSTLSPWYALAYIVKIF